MKNSLSSTEKQVARIASSILIVFISTLIYNAVHLGGITFSIPLITIELILTYLLSILIEKIYFAIEKQKKPTDKKLGWALVVIFLLLLVGVGFNAILLFVGTYLIVFLWAHSYDKLIIMLQPGRYLLLFLLPLLQSWILSLMSKSKKDK